VHRQPLVDIGGDLELLGLRTRRQQFGDVLDQRGERKRAGLEGLAGRLRTLSPKATLSTGYAIVRTDEGIVRSATALDPGDRVDVELAEGGFGARVEESRS